MQQDRITENLTILFFDTQTKKRSRQDAMRSNNLIYIEFNATLLDRKIKEKGQLDIFPAKEASEAQGWLVDGDDDGETMNSSLIEETWREVEEAKEGT